MRTLLVALATAATLSITVAPAEATRPNAGHNYPDLCKNRGAYAMPGKQTALMFPMGRVWFVDPNQEPNRVGRRDCEAVTRGR